MTHAEKTAMIAELKEVFSESNVFYVTDCSTMSVAQVNKLRRKCFDQGIQLRVVKNTLIRKALEQISETEYTDLYGALNGPTAVMFGEPGNAPAKLIKEFRGDKDRPFLKAAYIHSAIYIGDDQLDELTKIKSKDELLGELIGLLMSPATNLVSALQSGGNTLAGLLKTLEERGN